MQIQYGLACINGPKIPNGFNGLPFFTCIGPKSMPIVFPSFVCATQFPKFCPNMYQASLRMIPFEALYGRKFNTPVSF
jgi:hypothetical protein